MNVLRITDESRWVKNTKFDTKDNISESMFFQLPQVIPITQKIKEKVEEKNGKNRQHKTPEFYLSVCHQLIHIVSLQSANEKAVQYPLVSQKARTDFDRFTDAFIDGEYDRQCSEPYVALHFFETNYDWKKDFL